MSWIKHSEVDFAQGNEHENLAFHIDTRDFRVSMNGYLPSIDLFCTRKNPDDFFFTPQEVKDLIERLYQESEGDNEWRMLTLEGSAERFTSSWQLKYIRVYRLRHRLWKGLPALVIYSEEDKKLFSKELLSNKVNLTYLHAH